MGWPLSYYEETSVKKIYVPFSLSATSVEEEMEKCHYKEEYYYG